MTETKAVHGERPGIPGLEVELGRPVSGLELGSSGYRTLDPRGPGIAMMAADHEPGRSEKLIGPARPVAGISPTDQLIPIRRNSSSNSRLSLAKRTLARLRTLFPHSSSFLLPNVIYRPLGC